MQFATKFIRNIFFFSKQKQIPLSSIYKGIEEFTDSEDFSDSDKWSNQENFSDNEKLEEFNSSGDELDVQQEIGDIK